MKEKFKTTKEFSNILKCAWKDAKERGLASIPFEAVLYHLLDSYIETDPAEIPEQNLVLRKLIDEIDVKELKSLRDRVKEEYEDSCERLKNNLPKTYTEDLVFEPTLDEAIQSCIEFGNVVNLEKDGEFDVDIFLATSLKFQECYCVELFIECGFSTSKIMSYIAALKKAEEALGSSIKSVLGIGGITPPKDGTTGLEREIPTSTLKEDEDNFETYGENVPLNASELDPNSDTPFLDNYSQDMTKEALSGKYDPVIGREDVIDSILEILCKRKKPNVCLTGLPGVGKTSIVERLAQRISEGDVPEKLIGKRVCSLNLNDLVAGTKYRGEYEERLQKIVKEVCENKNVIIYIDEFHNLIGNGSQSGSGDGANILKPYLSRGDFQCIGSTTTEEYRKFIAKDKALERRFTCIEIQEPSDEETLKIIKAVIPKYENYHAVRYSKSALDCAIEWSNRYITGKQQPDKTIDVLDMAGSMVELRKEMPEERQALIKEIEQLAKDKSRALKVEKDFNKLETLDAEEKIKQEALDKLDKELGNKKNWPEVTEEKVAECISRISRVPIDKISQTDMKKMSVMKEEISKKVIGQDKAIQVVTEALQRNVLGLRNPKKPIASILACGPTGVGKTLLCKEIANIFFGSEKALIKIDGGTLKGGEMAVNTLIGSSAGYVGYGEEAVLEKVKRMPRCVLLFDEIEKADKAIYDVLLSLLDEGTVKLNNNDVVHFENCIVIFTSNLGAKEMKNKISLGFGEKTEGDADNEKIVRKAIEKNFKPEFINRLNSIITFNELGEKELNKIFDIELKKIKDTLTKSKVTFKVSQKLKKYVVSLCTEGMGARELSRNIEEHIISPLSKQLLETPDNKKYEINLNDDKTVEVRCV